MAAFYLSGFIWSRRIRLAPCRISTRTNFQTEIRKTYAYSVSSSSLLFSRWRWFRNPDSLGLDGFVFSALKLTNPPIFKLLSHISNVFCIFLIICGPKSGRHLEYRTSGAFLEVATAIFVISWVELV